MDFDLRRHPAYVAWSERNAEVQRERSAVAAQLEDAQQRRLAQRDPSRVHAQAVALLDGEPVDEAEDVEATIRSLGRRLKIVEGAVAVSKSREREVIADIMRQEGPRLRVAYVAILREMLPLVRTLGALADREARFREVLLRQGAPFLSHFPALPLRDARIGGPDPSSASRWVAEVLKAFPELDA